MVVRNNREERRRQARDFKLRSKFQHDTTIPVKFNTKLGVSFEYRDSKRTEDKRTISSPDGADEITFSKSPDDTKSQSEVPNMNDLMLVTNKGHRFHRKWNSGFVRDELRRGREARLRVPIPLKVPEVRLGVPLKPPKNRKAEPFSSDFDKIVNMLSWRKEEGKSVKEKLVTKASSASKL